MTVPVVHAKCKMKMKQMQMLHPGAPDRLHMQLVHRPLAVRANQAEVNCWQKQQSSKGYWALPHLQDREPSMVDIVNLQNEPQSHLSGQHNTATWLHHHARMRKAGELAIDAAGGKSCDHCYDTQASCISRSCMLAGAPDVCRPCVDLCAMHYCDMHTQPQPQCMSSAARRNMCCTRRWPCTAALQASTTWYAGIIMPSAGPHHTAARYGCRCRHTQHPSTCYVNLPYLID